MSNRAYFIMLAVLLYVLSITVSITVTYYYTENRAYQDGYTTAIHNAVLQSVSEDGYTLSFEGEIHQYNY